MSGEGPVGTTLAILERTLKSMSAIQARVHYAMHEEFRLLKDIIRDFMPPDYSYEPVDGDPAVKQSDYDLVDVLPVSDPNASTMAQKVVQYQAVLQLAAGAPQLYDLPLLHRQMLDVLGIKNASKLVPMQDDQRPRDPVTENMDILKGKPVKAFFYQDHEAHIAVHQMAMQDPKVMGLLQQNPNAQGMQAAMMAHINEHLGYEYKKQIEAQIGMQIPDYEDEQTIPEDMETQIAQRAAQASQQLLQQHQMEAQQQAQQQMQDPIIQMQMQELQIKQSELKLKQQKQQIDAASKADQIRIEEARIAAQKEIAAMQVGAQAAANKDKLARQQETEGMRMGIDAAKHRAQVAVQQAQRNRTPRKEN